MNNYDDVEEILDEFDFETVKKVMDFLDWCWYWTGDEPPTIGEIRKKARQMLRECKDRVLKMEDVPPTVQICTGGFLAEADLCENGKVYYKLSFIVTDWDNYD